MRTLNSSAQRQAPGPTEQTFFALGTTASVIVSEPGVLRGAATILQEELSALDLAASRFRPDSELAVLNRSAGRPVEVSPLLLDAILAALRAARLTGGLVDPTVGEALAFAGYDRDFASVDPVGPPIRLRARPVPGWSAVHVDPVQRTVTLPAGVTLDLGATAKALCADRCATRIAEQTGVGTLINLGGDIAVSGPAPEGGWAVRITHDHSLPPKSAPGPVVAISSGGLATSSTSVRRWVRGCRAMHHLIDPSTGLPAAEHWRTASIAASSCLDANIASCASILLGPRAPAWLSDLALPGRLVAPGGRVTTVGGWPPDSCAGPLRPVGAPCRP